MANLIDGKMLRDLSVTAAKLAAAFTNTLFLKDGSVALTGTVNANGQRIINLPAPLADTDPARMADLYTLAWKASCVAATTANITLSGPQTIDGISVTATAPDRVLVKNQTLPANNGIYLVNAGAWVRAPDNDSAAEMRGAVVSIEQGTVNADHRFTMNVDAVTLGTTAITWVDIGTGTLAAFDTTSNKSMAASTTTADFQVACATAIATKPAGSAYVRVSVNGVGVDLGDGVKTKASYFSADSGTTAKTIANIAAGDVLYWVQSVAGYNLASATDVIDFDYAV